MIPNISTHQISSMFDDTELINVQKCIREAGTKAEELIAKGAFIREAHKAGRENSSCVSTMVGTLKSAETVADVFGEKTKVSSSRFFGNHLREAVCMIKGYVRKK